jgi:predicted nucleic acid-binding protein
MHKIIISDTSCFITLFNAGEMDLLRKVYTYIYTTNEVAAEFGEPLPEWIIIETAKDKQKQLLLEMQIDRGESSAIALALETENSVIILDDNKARKLAEKLGLNFTGTIGVIIKAKLNGIISSIKPILQKIKENGFHLTDEIEQRALKEAKE